MAEDKLDRVFKILLNKRGTNADKKYYEEFGDNTVNIHMQEVWSSPIDIDPLVAIEEEFVEIRELFVLTEDSTVPGQVCWYAEVEGERLKDWVSDKYGADYTAKLYTASDQQIYPTDSSDWFFDYQTGILTFSGSVSEFTKPFKSTGYRYIGVKGGLGEDGVLKINSFPECNTPYNKSFMLDVPPQAGVYQIEFNIASNELLLDKKVELAGYSMACSGYGDGDYLIVKINEHVIEDTWYTREVAENVVIGGGVAVYSLPTNSIITIDFHNVSETSKKLWFKVKLLYTP